MNRTVLATAAGALTSFVVGFLISGLALASFFAANTGSATGAIKDPPNLVAIALGQIPSALLLTLAIGKWGNSTSTVGGAKVGALFGLLIAASVDLTIYGTTNVQNLTVTLVDPIFGTLLTAVTGAVVGMVLGWGKSASAA